MKILITIALGIILGVSVARAEEKKNFNLVEICKGDCPTAKTNAEAHKCAEKMARLNKDFKKSKCWEVNEQYEAAQAAEVGQ